MSTVCGSKLHAEATDELVETPAERTTRRQQKILSQGRSHQSGWSGFNRTTFRPIGDIFLFQSEVKYTVHALWSINYQEN